MDTIKKEFQKRKVKQIIYGIICWGIFVNSALLIQTLVKEKYLFGFRVDNVTLVLQVLGLILSYKIFYNIKCPSCKKKAGNIISTKVCNNCSVDLE